MPSLDDSKAPSPAPQGLDWRAFGLFVGACAVVLCAYLLPRDAPWLPRCLWKSWTGHACPFCGSTRAFQSMAHGDWQQGFTDNPLAALLFVALLLAAGWNLLRWLRCRPVLRHARGRNGNATA